MFFYKKKEEAISDHEQASKELETVYSEVVTAANKLNQERDLACELIQKIESYINQMSRTPKSIDRRVGEIDVEMSMLKKTEEYAQEAYDAAVKSGVFTASGVAVGVGMTVMSSSEWKNLTTTFGRENADKIIQTFSDISEKSNAAKLLPMEKLKNVGKKIYEHLGIIGIGITAASLTIGIAYVSYKNYDISNQLIDGTIEIDKEINHLKKKRAEIEGLTRKLTKLVENLKNGLQKLRVLSGKYRDYVSLSKQSKEFLKTYINDTYALAVLLNKDIK